jgi:hypothetical protein
MKRTAILLFVLASFFSFFWMGCTREKLTSTCDTQNMSYKNNIIPILKNNCYGCHSAGNSVGSIGIRLDIYDTLAYYAKHDYLIGDITHSRGFVGMPYMKPQLDACSINQIISWVIDGALPN